MNLLGRSRSTALKGTFFFALAASRYKPAFATVCQSDQDIPAPREADFDCGFDVPFDNGANASIGISKDNFSDLQERRGSMTGVGAAQAEGMPVHVEHKIYSTEEDSTGY